MDVFKDIADFVSDVTKLEQFKTYALAAVGTGIAFYASLKHELQKAKRIPLAYSELDNLKSEAKFRGEEIGSLTNFLTSINDLCMQVFESHNHSYSKQYMRSTAGFGEELFNKLNQRNHGSNLQDLLTNTQKYAKESREKLTEHIQLMNDLSEIVGNFSQAWKEDHTDHYRTEYYTTTETDSKGNTRTVTHSRQVYDHTEHEYWYDINAGRIASDNLAKMYEKRPELKKIETFTPATNISEEGKTSSQESRSEKKLYTEEDFKKFGRMWFDGTKHDDDLEAMIGEYGQLESHALHWKDAKETPRKYYNYNTCSTSDSGPREYQIAMSTKHLAANIEGQIGNLVHNIDMVTELVPKLSSDILRYVDTTKLYQQFVATDDGKSTKKEVKKLRKEIMKNTKEMYSAIFSDGIDMDRIKESHIVMWSIAGALAGAGLGQLYQYLTNQPTLF